MKHLSKIPRKNHPIVSQILGAQGLDGERHIHNLRRMSVPGGKVHKPAFRYDVNLTAIREIIFLNILSRRLLTNSKLLELGDIHLAVEVTGVAADRSVLHRKEMLLRDDIVAARDGDEYVAFRSGLSHTHNLEPIHHGLHRLDRIHLCDNHFRPEALGSHRHTLATPSIAGDNDIFPGHDQVGGPVDAIPDGLACAVTIVEEMLAGGVVHEHHRESQPPFTVHRLKAEDSGRGLLAAADDVRNQFWIVLVDHRDKVSPIVNDDVRATLDDTPDAVLIFLGSRPVDSEYVQPLVHKGRGHIVLRGKRVAAGDIHLGTALGQHLAKMRRLGLQMHGKGDLQPLERLSLLKLLLQTFKQRHMMPYPFYLQLPAFPELRVTYLTHQCKIYCNIQKCNFRHKGEYS